ncbi:hypothetical protein J1N35_011831 [Gossypium stocksii]|uniref:Uncharacterized protein n=1 Tax=Gossypium stocksii TaxID=47602 RepID=A0A9D3W4X3_9ROSI|nr:hypothetical protein J1N35_011831 [Gossypium stocksii]
MQRKRQRQRQQQQPGRGDGRLYFNAATMKMLLSNLFKWEALPLLLIGIGVNQPYSLPQGISALGLPVTTIALVSTY